MLAPGAVALGEALGAGACAKAPRGIATATAKRQQAVKARDDLAGIGARPPVRGRLINLAPLRDEGEAAPHKPHRRRRTTGAAAHRNDRRFNAGLFFTVGKVVRLIDLLSADEGKSWACRDAELAAGAKLPRRPAPGKVALSPS